MGLFTINYYLYCRGELCPVGQYRLNKIKKYYNKEKISSIIVIDTEIKQLIKISINTKMKFALTMYKIHNLL